MTHQRIKYALELDGSIYGLSGNRLVPVTDIRDLDGDICLVTDMQESISRAASIEASYKYAELMVRKGLQEAGDFEEPVRIITHWKKKSGSNNTDILFTAVPMRLTQYYFDQLRSESDNILVFTLYNLLVQIITRLKAKSPVAVIFRHHRFADMIIGDSRQIYYARKYIAFDTEEGQIQALWSMLNSDLESVESEHRIKIEDLYAIDWIDTDIEKEASILENRRLHYLPNEIFYLEEKALELSLLGEVRKLSISKSDSPLSERLLFMTKRATPYAAAISLFIIAAIFSGFFVLTNKISHHNMLAQELEAKINQITPGLALNMSESEYVPVMKFTKELSYLRQAPAYRRIINDIAYAASNTIGIEVFRLDYTSEEVRIEVFGRIQAPFDIAHSGYQRFLNILRIKSYEVKESRFDTKIDESEVLIKLTRRIS